MHIGGNRARAKFNGNDRITHELAGTVVGDVATAIDAKHLRTDRVGIVDYVLGLRPHPQGVNVRVLEQQQVVLVAATEKRVLQRERVSVGDASELAYP